MQSSSSLPSHLQIINLRNEYNEDILEHFHEYIMKKYFPIHDELDPIDVWLNNMRPENRNKQSHVLLPEMHICIAFDKRHCEPNNSNIYKIAAASVFEYYKLSNCALLSYFMVNEDYRELGMGKYMVNYAYDQLKQISARIYSSIDELIHNYTRDIQTTEEEKEYFEQVQLLRREVTSSEFCTFFAETNAWGVDDGVMEASKRHQIMRRIGFRMLDFDYLQLPLSEEQEPCSDLILLALNVPDLPNNNDTRYVPTQLVRVFLLEFGYSVFENMKFIREDYFQYVMNDLVIRGDKLYLSQENEIPWTRRTNYPIILTSKL
jgi:GNAT superfamily N-acetyltransferase